MPSSRRPPASGLTFSAPSGSLRSSLATTFTWSRLKVSSIFLDHAGNSYVVSSLVCRICADARPSASQHCTLCKHRHGACIQCAHPSCYTAFHVTCAREHGYLGTMKTLDEAHGGTGDSGLLSWCDKHLPVCHSFVFGNFLMSDVDGAPICAARNGRAHRRPSARQLEQQKISQSLRQDVSPSSAPCTSQNSRRYRRIRPADAWAEKKGAC